MSKRMTPADKQLRHEGIGHLLLRYSLPAIAAMVVSSIYNIIDRIFIGHGVGPMAISGLALTLPFMNLSAAFGAMVGAGAGTLTSIRMGESRGEELSHILGNVTILNLVLGSVYTLVMFLCLDPILIFFGASHETLPYAREFIQIILIGNVVTHSYMGFNNMMRASGHPRKAMVITIITVLVNLMLAPIFIFVLKWGIRGAAAATMLAQTAGLILVTHHFLMKSHVVHFRRDGFRISFRIIRDIISIGMSSFVIQTCICLITVLINRQLVKYGGVNGDYAVGAYGIINSIIMCIVMMVLGLVQGMQPIAGFNYGAKLYPRVTRVFKLTIYAATAVTTAGFLVGEIFPHAIVHAFTSDPTLDAISATGMRFILCMYPIVGFQMVTSNFFQSIGKAQMSIILSLSRQVLILIPLLFVLPLFWGLNGVWAALPAADLLSSAIAYICLKLEVRKIHGLDRAMQEA